jgi:nitroimidazol reductase NimA-like FMN-containing flavoprotein (pyridoxamine 5'-phosphate oxidase superfamily)
VSDDGYPASIPLWYDWDGTAFWLLPRPGAEWAEHIRRDPRVSLAVSESVPPLRRVLARGRADVLGRADERAWQRVERSIARRYAEVHAARHLASLATRPRQLLRLAPERLSAWRGLLRYPGARPERSPRTGAREIPA